MWVYKQLREHTISKPGQNTKSQTECKFNGQNYNTHKLRLGTFRLIGLTEHYIDRSAIG